MNPGCSRVTQEGNGSALDEAGSHREKHWPRLEIYFADLRFEIFPRKTYWEIGNEGFGKVLNQD